MAGGGSGITPEERQLRNERKRVQSYINSYERNPQNWTPSMITQLEQLTAQYQIPFKREVQDSSALWKAAGVLGGVADSAAFGLVPDKWYSDESNRVSANVGKIGGSVAQIAAAIAATIGSGGMAAPTIGKAGASLMSAIRGAKGIADAGKIAKAAGQLGATVASKGLVGRTASGAINMGRQTLAPYGAQQGWKWAKGAVESAERAGSAEILRKARTAISKTGDLGAAVKGQKLTKEQINLLSNQIRRKYAKQPKVADEYIKQLGMANSTGGLTGVNPSHLVKMAQSMNKNHNVTTSNIRNLLNKAGANSSDENVNFIITKLGEANIVKLDQKAVAEILKLANPLKDDITKIGIGDLDKWGLVGTAGMAVGAGSSLMDYTPSREELERQEDPYDPYNR